MEVIAFGTTSQLKVTVSTPCLSVCYSLLVFIHFFFYRMDSLNEYSCNSFDLQSLLNSLPGDLEFKQIFSDIGEQMGQNAAR